MSSKKLNISWMTMALGNLQAQVEELAEEMEVLLRATLPDLPGTIVDGDFRHVRESQIKYVLNLGPNGKGLPLYVSGKELGTLSASIGCRLDSVKHYLAVEYSKFKFSANLDRTPIIRFDFMRNPDRAPTAHIQIHAHRGALSHVLSQADHPTPHVMESLHIPVGGSRFRPCLEDVVQFLVQECRFDSNDGWREWIEAGRERWRRKQVAAATRDVHDEAARVLRGMGYLVIPPSGLESTSKRKALRNW